MTTIVTGSAGHLGEALMRSFRAAGRDAVGVDLVPSPFTDAVGSICDRSFVKHCMRSAAAVIHSATLHKPHIAHCSDHDFVDTNMPGTLNLLEEALAEGVQAFVYTSTTSALRSSTRPRGRPTGGLDHRSGDSNPEEHLRRHQDRRRESLRVVLPPARTSLNRAADVSILPGSGR